MSKIEDFWGNATADDVARVMAGETVEARFRDSTIHLWRERLELTGVNRGIDGKPRWIASTGSWVFCQVYREPSWWTERPDPGPEHRLLGKLPDEELEPGDECFASTGVWDQSFSATIGAGQSYGMWYRRRIEQLLSGHRWLANGDRLGSGDLYYEKGALLEVPHEYWGNNVMLTEAFMRKIEPIEPRFAVGQTVKVVGPKGSDAKQWSEEMNKHIGKESAVNNREKKHSGWFYDLGCSATWSFREDYLEPVEPGPKHYVLRVGDTVETPSGHLIKVVSPDTCQMQYELKAGYVATLPNGQTITITEKGFEVTE